MAAASFSNLAFKNDGNQVAIAQAGGVQELVVKTGHEGEEEYIWRVPASDNSDWRIGQVPTKGRVMFEAVEGEDLAGYVVLDQVG